ncbi:unnamed protein product [Microthlaspi erraticum]|uniref:Arabidopsis retrotransposon Orf1 C-terminal domain-containing protein n=1 Tax=Microthlaspi erraticum TaxID=1685480 RepID=A0A6D2JW45_9BRAS|nr:unnamed protein product [Microthlaspi erraticum]
MDFVETKYPHVDTMKALGIFEDVELVLKNMHLAKFFSYHMESYKELTCEFLASMSWRSCLGSTMEKVSGTSRKENSKVWATIADGVYSSSRSKAAQIRSPVLRYVHKALANTFFARKAPGHQRGGTQVS